jgi:hypothetical protein
MSIAKSTIISVLSPSLPNEIVNHLLDEYQDIKQHFALGKFRPSELNGGRFAECILRLIQHLNNPPYTPFGTHLNNTDNIIRRVESDTSLHPSIRLYIPRLVRILLDIRNRRDIAHVGGDVSPNISDSLFISHSVDWIMIEIIRIYYNCPIEEAKAIVESINEVKVPVVANIDGFLRVQDTSLDYKQKTLVILYHKNPDRVKDDLLIKWTRYSNPSAFKKTILKKLDKDALIHYEKNMCTLLPKGIQYVEKNISMEIIV